VSAFIWGKLLKTAVMTESGKTTEEMALFGGRLMGEQGRRSDLGKEMPEAHFSGMGEASETRKGEAEASANVAGGRENDANSKRKSHDGAA